MVRKVNHKELAKLLQIYYNCKKPLIITGTFGIGKSYVVKEQAIAIANTKSREFVEWNKLSTSEKLVVYDSPKRYFVLLDIRLSESDPSDTKGLPAYQDRDYIKWIPPQFAKLLEHPDSDGILFFDEINLATPLVISSVYKIIYDRVINDSKISDNWSIAAAGNLEEDKAYTYTLAPPVKDRGGEVELEKATAEDWIQWAASNKIDKRIIGYISWQKHRLYYVNHDDEQKYTTPRGWERLHTLINNVSDYTDLALISSSAISESIASEFTAFCKLQDAVNINDVVKNPAILKTFKAQIDIKYFIIASLGDRYGSKELPFSKIIDITHVLDEMNDPEYVGLLWSLCTSYDKKRFTEEYLKSKVPKEITDKYSRYIIK